MFILNKFVINNLSHQFHQFGLFYFLFIFFIIFQILVLAYSLGKIILLETILVFQILEVLRKSFAHLSILILLIYGFRIILVLVFLGFESLVFDLMDLEFNFILCFYLYLIQYFLVHSHFV